MPIQPIFCLLPVAIVKLLCVAALSYSMIRKSGYRFSPKDHAQKNKLKRNDIRHKIISL